MIKSKKEVKKAKEKNNKYAVIRINGRQHLVLEGKELLVDKLKDAKNTKPEVLLVVDGQEVKVGKPVLKNVSVKIKVVTEEEKGEKLRVFKYKSKSRYRKTIGFRPRHTRVLIEKIVQ